MVIAGSEFIFNATQWGVLLFSGIASAFFGAFAGIGGGVIFIPFGYFVFRWAGIPETTAFPMAVGTSFLAAALVSAATAMAKGRAGEVIWMAPKMALPGLLIGGFTGAAIAVAFAPSTGFQKVLFGAYLLFVAVQVFFRNNEGKEHRHLSRSGMIGSFGGMAAVTSFVGVSGQTAVLSILKRLDYDMSKAVGTGAAFAAPIGLAACLPYFIAPLLGRDANQIVGAVGLVNVSAAIVMAIPAFLLAGMFSNVSRKFAAKSVKTVFAAITLAVGVQMAFFPHIIVDRAEVAAKTIRAEEIERVARETAKIEEERAADEARALASTENERKLRDAVLLAAKNEQDANAKDKKGAKKNADTKKIVKKKTKPSDDQS